MRLLTLKSLVACLVSLWCLVESVPVSSGAEYGVSNYQPPAPAYQAPSYQQQSSYQQPTYQQPQYQPPSYSYKPQYYETYDTYVDYMPANYSKKCGVIPAVHHHSYGYKDENERQAFGEFPWQVAITDGSYNYLCAGAIIAPRFVITSYKCIKGKSEYDLKVRIGDFDLSSNHNYLEAYKNYEVGVCKKHEFTSAYGYGSYSGGDEYSYDVVILELQEDIDFDHYPQASTLCLPEYYEKPKPYYPSYQAPQQYGGYGSSYQQAAPAPAPQESSPQELECWVGGWKESPLEKVKYQAEKQENSPYGGYTSGGYGYSYKPKTYYDYYDPSRTPRKAKVHKVYEYESYNTYGGYQQPKSQYGGYGYSKPYKTENWEAEYYYDACHADQGAPVFCLVPAKYEYSYETYAPQYTPPPSYEPSYSPPPTYEQPSYQPPAYGYEQPAYQPAYQEPSYSYQPPAYEKPSYGYEQPAYQPAYQEPSYGYQQPAYQPPAYEKPSYGYEQPAYQPAYQEPSYQPPAYQPPSYNSYEKPTPSYGYSQPQQPSYNRYKRGADYYQQQPAYGYQQPVYQEPAYQPPAYGYEQPAYQPTYEKPSYGYEQPAYQPAYQEPSYGYEQPAYQPPYQQPAYQAPTYEYESYPITIIGAEKKEYDYRRAVLVGVVSYGTSCSNYNSYGYGGYNNKQESKKIQVTPVKNIVDWILGVLKSANSCAAYGYSSYSTPTYGYEQPAYQPTYSPPTYGYEQPAYQPTYSAPTYSSYSPPAYSAPATYSSY